MKLKFKGGFPLVQLIHAKQMFSSEFFSHDIFLISITGKLERYIKEGGINMLQAVYQKKVF